MRTRFAILASLLLLSVPVAAAAAPAAEDQAASQAKPNQYEVLPPRSPMRWNIWASEGPNLVSSDNQSFGGNRFRLGGELHWGEMNQWIFGIAILDFISSGETSADVGDISRSGTDLELGYFLVPDKLWGMYSLHLAFLDASRMTGHDSAVGHQLSVGYRVYQKDNVNVSLEAAYLYVPKVSVDVIDLTTGLGAIATYPIANVWSLNLRVGFDFFG